MGKLGGKKIAFLQTDGVEQVELVKPLEASKVPGGVANPDFLRVDEDAVANPDFLRVDEDAVAFVVTSRTPDDLPAFIDKAIEELCEGEHEEQARSVGSAAS